MIFGITGIALLYVVTVLSHPVEVDNFNTLPDYEGQQVSVEGTVLSYKTTETGELVISIYNNKNTLDVIVENNVNNHQNIEINSIIEATGEVHMNYRGDYEIVVTDSNNVHITGRFNPPELNLTYMEPYNNTYATTSGTVLELEDYYGDALRLTVQNGSDRLEIIVYDSPSALTVGDIIDIDGVLRDTRAGHRLFCYSRESITVTGRWEFDSPGLADISSRPEAYLNIPCNVLGFVRYEPYTQPATSFYISNSPAGSELNFRVQLTEPDHGIEMHKGDGISMVTCTAFDESSLRYYLRPLSIELVSSYGEWEVTICDLAENTYEYERALLNLSGYLHDVCNEYILTDRAVMENSSIYLPITPPFNEPERFLNESVESPGFFFSNDTQLLNIHPGSRVYLHGRLSFEPLRFSYSFTLEPNPSDVFWFPYFG
jgi:hypothetical protein